MKKTQKLTFSGIMAALACVLLLGGYFPYLTYAIPAVAGLFVMTVLIETGTAYAVGCYAVSGILALLLCEKEVAVLYLCLFGYYPIVKVFIEKIRKPVVEWVLKILLFNLAAVVSFAAASYVFGVPYDDMSVLGKYGIYIFAFACNVVFVLYDIAISRVAGVYFTIIHPKIKNIIK